MSHMQNMHSSIMCFTLPITVMLFILRGVSLFGIDSVSCSLDKRQSAWERVIELLPENYYQQAAQIIELDEVAVFADKIVKGHITGRVLVKV